MAIGRLDVLLGLDAAQFVTGLQQSQREAEKFQKSITDLGKNIGKAIAGVSFVAIVKSAIDAQDRLNDLSKATGVAVTTLGGLGFAGKQAGTDLEGVSAAFGKLNIKIAEAARGEEEASDAFKKIGVSVKDAAGQTKSADKIFAEIATAFEAYADGPEKAALSNAFFSKSFREMAPLLADGGQQLRANIAYFERFGGVTAETAKAADEFNDTIGKIELLIQGGTRSIVNDMLPALQALADEFVRVGEASGSISLLGQIGKTVVETLGVLFVNFKFVLEGVGREIAAIAAQLVALANLDFDGFRAISDAVKEDGVRARKELDALEQRILGLAAGPSLASKIGTVNPDRELERLTRPKVTAPALRVKGGSKPDEAAKLAKKQLDEQLSQLDNFIRREGRLLEERNASLDRLYDLDRLSIQDYFAAKTKALDDATFETADIYREQIDDLKKFVSETKDETLKLQALKELGRKTEQQADFLSDSSRKATKLRDDAEKALAAYGARVEEVRTKVLELAGAESNAAEIAARRFDASNADLLSQANRQGDEETKRNLALLRQRAIDQTKVNSLLEQSRVIQQNLGTAEGRLALERDLGLRSELDTYTELGRARSASVVQLQKMADEYAAMAAAFKDPAMIAQAKAFQLSIDELAASVDVLGNRIRGEFKESFSNAFEGLLVDLQDGKNALDSFKDFFRNFTNDIVRNINRLATQSIADALFKGSGSSGGAGAGTLFADFFANLFGSGGGGQNLSGVFASGTDFVPRDGLAYLHRGERVVTATENRNSTSQTNNFTFVLPPGGYTRATQDQIASDASRALNRARRIG